MKKVILRIIMFGFIVLSVVFWARKLASGLPASSYIYDASRVMALVGFVIILFQYVLSSRINLIERDIGLDKLFLEHRRHGVIGLALIFLHPVLLYTSAFMQGHNPFIFPLLKVVGIVAFCVLMVTALAAMLYGRIRMKYGTWKNIHRASYIILPLGFIHSFFMGSDIAGSQTLKIFWIVMACIYIIVVAYRVWNWANVRRHPFKVAEVSQESHDTWSLHFAGEHPAYKPGQFMIIKLVRDGKSAEPHPFTISSSPTRDRLSISVKSVGDFTSTIRNAKADDTAYIEMPYGALNFLNHDDKDLVFIAGGIGITPFMSMLRYIYDSKLDKNVTLIWGNKAEEDILFREEMDRMTAEMPSLNVVHVISKQENWPGEKGYVDSEMLKRHISNFQSGQFFLCGPPRMMFLVEKMLRDLNVAKKRIHYERFALR
ncbi:ferric reductase-like transmembrane domain-containing protein [Candidatus Poribacteria bacterium]